MKKKRSKARGTSVCSVVSRFHAAENALSLSWCYVTMKSQLLDDGRDDPQGMSEAAVSRFVTTLASNQ